jgi:cyanophycinase-like exopeptidase
LVYPPAGRPGLGPAANGPGLVLSGSGLLGMPYVEVLRWIRSRMLPATGRAGRLLIVQASGENDYTAEFYRRSALGSIQEILVPPCAPRSSVNALAPYADRADAVLFVGGDQSHYVAWKGTALIDAIRRVYARGGVVGGGSAGLAIQGQVVYDSVAADRVLPDDQNVGSVDATRNPYEPAISFTTGLFAWPSLVDTITDSHFARRNRFGRLAAFMARSLRDGLVRGPRVYGLGIDEGSALVVDRRGVATLVEQTGGTYATRGAYLLSGGAASRIRPGSPLLYTVDVVHLTRIGGGFDLLHHRGGSVTRYTVTVDGSRRGLYDRDPY